VIAGREPSYLRDFQELRSTERELLKLEQDVLARGGYNELNLKALPAPLPTGSIPSTSVAIVAVENPASDIVQYDLEQLAGMADLAEKLRGELMEQQDLGSEGSDASRRGTLLLRMMVSELEGGFKLRAGDREGARGAFGEVIELAAVASKIGDGSKTAPGFQAMFDLQRRAFASRLRCTEVASRGSPLLGVDYAEMEQAGDDMRLCVAMHSLQLHGLQSCNLGADQKLPWGLKVQGVMLLLHGFGTNGQDLGYIGKEMKGMRGIGSMRYIYPEGRHQLPSPPFSSAAYSWANVLHENHPGCLEGLLGSVAQVHKVIDMVMKEEEIPASKVHVVGFAMGAVLAALAALSYKECLGGLGMLSGWPSIEQLKYLRAFHKDFGGELREPRIAELYGTLPVFLGTGADDDEATARQLDEFGTALQSCGLNRICKKVYEGVGHSIHSQELRDLGRFLEQCQDEDRGTA